MEGPTISLIIDYTAQIHANCTTAVLTEILNKAVVLLLINEKKVLTLLLTVTAIREPLYHDLFSFLFSKKLKTSCNKKYNISLGPDFGK